jgi:hypothetical protein
MTRTSHTLSFLCALLLSSCGAAQHAAVTPVSIAREEAAIAAVLDDWHAAAAASDEARYFDHFADEGVFLGTDATERWDVAAFRAYAHGPFSEGRGWVMRSVRRVIQIEGDVAWFDEDLETVNLGPSRGTGALVRREGRWRIALYSLTITVPNERFDGVRALLAEPAPASE